MRLINSDRAGQYPEQVFKCIFAQTRQSCANMQLFIILNIYFVGKYRVLRMRFEHFSSWLLLIGFGLATCLGGSLGFWPMGRF